MKEQKEKFHAAEAEMAQKAQLRKVSKEETFHSAEGEKVVSERP